MIKRWLLLKGNRGALKVDEVYDSPCGYRKRRAFHSDSVREDLAEIRELCS